MFVCICLSHKTRLPRVKMNYFEMTFWFPCVPLCALAKQDSVRGKPFEWGLSGRSQVRWWWWWWWWSKSCTPEGGKPFELGLQETRMDKSNFPPPQKPNQRGRFWWEKTQTGCQLLFFSQSRTLLKNHFSPEWERPFEWWLQGSSQDGWWGLGELDTNCTYPLFWKLLSWNFYLKIYLSIYENEKFLSWAFKIVFFFLLKCWGWSHYFIFTGRL